MKIDSVLRKFTRPSRKLKFSTALRATLSFLAIFAFPVTSHATEEPEYKVVLQIGDAEVREYFAYTVAEVVVTGSAETAGNLAFPILAGYIFGKNTDQRKFAMTAPVTQTAAPVKLEMTAPIMQKAAPGGFLVQFVLPKGVTLATAPKPLDARVALREVPRHRVAVIRYSGFWSEANYSEHLAKLQADLRHAGLISVGEPVYARYNAPFTPWFMRRNEIWLSLVDSP